MGRRRKKQISLQQKEGLLNSQGCANRKGLCWGERELPVTKEDQTEKLDKTLNEKAAEGRLALQKWDGRILRFQDLRFYYDFCLNSATVKSLYM